MVANSKYFSGGELSVDAQEFFRNHDIAHVVFGCDASIVGEAKVKIWSISEQHSGTANT
ncbi:hypothetical protein JYT35_00405 [Acidimicrobium ferrooxidans]|uniref:Uncharacterized protein n=1 Tax=Acidimicrobium ferrooxidans TaxID=53635 RepID=A0ABS3ANZ6_9ACTN|nr:hypothetical protein [Acidimicrobium ferrooxidans]